MGVTYKFEGYRILLVHNEEPIWDMIHSRIMETDCDLFAVNSAKDALALMQFMNFDIIISAYDRNETNGRELFQDVNGSTRNAIKILQKKRHDSGIKWRLLLSGVDDLSRNSLELESMLAVISNQFNGNGGDNHPRPLFSDLHQRRYPVHHRQRRVAPIRGTLSLARQNRSAQRDSRIRAAVKNTRGFRDCFRCRPA